MHNLFIAHLILAINFKHYLKVKIWPMYPVLRRGMYDAVLRPGMYDAVIRPGMYDARPPSWYAVFSLVSSLHQVR